MSTMIVIIVQICALLQIQPESPLRNLYHPCISSYIGNNGESFFTLLHLQPIGLPNPKQHKVLSFRRSNGRKSWVALSVNNKVTHIECLDFLRKTFKFILLHMKQCKCNELGKSNSASFTIIVWAYTFMRMSRHRSSPLRKWSNNPRHLYTSLFSILFCIYCKSTGFFCQK